MKIEITLYALSYASVLSDGELYTDTIGIYDKYELAEQAMNDNVNDDIQDGDDEDCWGVNGNCATYDNDMTCEHKMYSIKEFKKEVTL